MRMHAQGLSLGIGRLRKSVGGYENARYPAVLKIDEIVHTARCTRASVGQGLHHRGAFGGDSLAQVARRRF